MSCSLAVYQTSRIVDNVRQDLEHVMSSIGNLPAKFRQGAGCKAWYLYPSIGLISFNLCIPASAQTTGPEPVGTELQARIEQAARDLAGDPRMKGYPKMVNAVEFVAGNTLFALLHEMGHTAISEMGLPVLGREEDAADAFAVLVGLKLGTKFSEGVAANSAYGWFLSARREQKEGIKPVFYDEHGLDQQRAYNIVCLMVGSDPDKFKALADKVKLPEERQGTCEGDYSNASWSWEKELAPHRRMPDQPKTKIDAAYRDADGSLANYANIFRRIKMLEAVADLFSDRFAWRRPFTLEMRGCGQPNAHWDLPARTTFVCYELAADYAQLYRDYADEPFNISGTNAR